MALKIVQSQDWSGNFAYAPPLKDTVLNTDDIISVRECESRGSGPWVSVTMRNGEKFTVKGTPQDFVE
jgi:hypothetical protein